MCLHPSPKQKSQQLVPAGKVFGLLVFCFYFLLLIAVTVPRLVFRGRKHRTVRFVLKKLEINLAYGLGSQTRLSLLLHLHPSQ